MRHPDGLFTVVLGALLASRLSARFSPAALVLLGTLLASPVIAQAPAMRPEFALLPTPGPTPGPQTDAAIAANGPGNFVIAWSRGGNSGDIFARRLTASGGSLGAAFQVNTYSGYLQANPSISSDDPGNFVVVWESPQDGDGLGIFGQRFDSSGTPQGPEFQANATVTSTQLSPDVAMNGPGSFVAVWTSVDQDGFEGGVFGQRYDNSGTPQGSEFPVNTYTTGSQDQPAAAMDPAGNFVVVWKSTGQIGSSSDIFGQRFDSSGNDAGGEFQINTYTPGDQAGPRVVFGSSGQFVVVWSSGYGQDGSGNGIVGRRFDASGSPLAPEFLINTYTTGDQQSPAVASDPSGRFIVSWNSLGQDGAGNSVFAQRFDASGRRVGQEFAINTYTTGNQQLPDVALDSNGQFVFAWESEGQGASSVGVFARGGGFPDAQPMNVDARASSASSNVNGILETGETVTVEPAWRNNSSFSLNLLGGASNFTGPPGPVYTINAGFAGYGTIAPGATNNCFDAAANCYEVAVSGTRPAAHWDATFGETLFVFPAPSKPWTLHIGESFPDVPISNQFYRFIENIFHNGITAGGACGGYCPSDSTLRQQMAVFVIKAKEGSGFTPPDCTGTFNDVPVSSPFCRWIEELARRGVVAGCGNGNYCPTDPVKRQQMPVFLLRTLEGSAYTPPDCTGTFADVPASSPFCRWIEEVARRGIAAGCGSGNYCPTAPTNRGQMAPFLAKTFGLPLYGP